MKTFITSVILTLMIALITIPNLKVIKATPSIPPGLMIKGSPMSAEMLAALTAAAKKRGVAVPTCAGGSWVFDYAPLSDFFMDQSYLNPKPWFGPLFYTCTGGSQNGCERELGAHCRSSTAGCNPDTDPNCTVHSGVGVINSMCGDYTDDWIINCYGGACSPATYEDCGAEW